MDRALQQLITSRVGFIVRGIARATYLSPSALVPCRSCEAHTHQQSESQGSFLHAPQKTSKGQVPLPFLCSVTSAGFARI